MSAAITTAQLFYHSPGSAPRIRVAVVLNSRWLPRYVRDMLIDLQRCDFIDLYCVSTQTSDASSGAHDDEPSRRLSWDGAGAHLLYRIYRGRIDVPKISVEDPEQRVHCAELLANLIPATALESLAALALDVLIQLSTGPLPSTLADLPRYGVWTFRYGDSTRYHGGPIGFWELYERSPLSGAELCRLGDQGASRVIARSQFATTETLSAARNRVALYRGSRYMLVHKLNELHRCGWDRLLDQAPPAGPYQGRRATYTEPSNTEMLKWSASQVAPRVVRRLLKRAPVKTWRVGLRSTADPLYVTRSPAGTTPFTWLQNPRGHYWADPFLVHYRGQMFLFMEDYDYATRKGSLIAVTVDAGGGIGAAVPVLERSYHLSYPFVFSHQGEMFMVPESGQAGMIDLYRARTFPHDWVKERTLLALPGVDSTLFRAQDRWWMLTSPLIGEDHPAATLLFSAGELDGEWRLHPNSPITTDVRHARSAGAVIQSAGRMIRVHQDCAGDYGRSLGFSEITSLSTDHYQERFLFSVEPGWLPRQIGVHTYNRAGDWEVIDGRFAVAAGQI